MNNSQNLYDVIILGSGISSSMMGMILAKSNLKVLIIEKKGHPRFAIGESTVPNTTLLMKILAKKYDVPELAYLADFYSTERHIGSSSGIKRGFSFLLHDEGRNLDINKCVQLPTLTPPFGPDIHYYRQDIDAYLLSIAIKYGADLKQNTTVLTMEDVNNEVVLKTNNGIYKAKFLVDGSGYNSFIAKYYNLRDNIPVYETNTRSIFTHMTNVTSYDQILHKEKHNLNYPLSQTTLHHLFKGGWMWVIPFDNHKFSTNNLCSVGITLDENVYPDNETPPEEEFKFFLDKFPSIKKQFESSFPFRDWVKTKRIQYSSKKVVGKNWALLPHSAGFIDPLFSAGLTLTCIGVGSLADIIINVKNEEKTEKLLDYEKLIQTNLRFQDKMVVNAYRSFSTDFSMWNAWFRVWCLGSILGGASMLRILCKYEETKDIKYLNQINEVNFNTLFSMQIPEVKSLFDKAESLIKQAYTGEKSIEETSNLIFKGLKECTIAPKYLELWKSENINITDFTLLTAWKLPISFHFNYDGKKEYKEIYADYWLFTIIKLTIKSYISFSANQYSPKKEMLRDLIIKWNNYWKSPKAKHSV